MHSLARPAAARAAGPLTFMLLDVHKNVGAAAGSSAGDGSDDEDEARDGADASPQLVLHGVTAGGATVRGERGVPEPALPLPAPSAASPCGPLQ
jgi:hypothetical protein